MALINENFIKIPATYLFSEIAKRVTQHKEANPDAPVIRMGIGDVSLPLPDASVDAMVKAAEEQRSAATFRGYGPEQGYDFLRNAIVANDYAARGLDIEADEIFVSDGAKSDTGMRTSNSIVNAALFCKSVFFIQDNYSIPKF